MPAIPCEGRPGLACPEKRCDKTVRLSQGDLMLCVECERFRFPDLVAQRQSSTKKDNSVGRTDLLKTQKQTSTKLSVSKSGDLTGSNSAPDGAASQSVLIDGAIDGVSNSGRTRPTPSDSHSASRQQSSDVSKPLDLTSSEVKLLAVAGTTAAKKVVLNDLLAYINCYRLNSTNEAVQKVVLVHFSPVDITAAKRILIKEFQSTIGVTQFATERRNSTARQAHEAEVEDVIAILDIVDTKNGLSDYVFVASNLHLMPKYGPEEINLAVVVDRQVHMDVAIANLSASVEQLTTRSPSAGSSSVVQQSIKSVSCDLQQQLCAFNDAIGARLDHLNSVCTKLAENAATRNVVHSSPRVERQGHDIDRSMNIMVFGVAENKDVRVWRCTVDRALQFVAGCAVDVKDMLRVGRFVDGKTRPIVVKLRTAWDQRLILAESRKLKDFEERIFFSADEPIEERRKKMLGRIKARAQSKGQVALVVDGVLSVDGKPVFSLNEGKLIQDGSH